MAGRTERHQPVEIEVRAPLGALDMVDLQGAPATPRGEQEYSARPEPRPRTAWRADGLLAGSLGGATVEWKMSLLREGHRPDDPSLCGTVMVEEPWVDQSSTDSNHTTKTGVGPFGQSSATSGGRPARSPSAGG